MEKKYVEMLWTRSKHGRQQMSLANNDMVTGRKDGPGIDSRWCHCIFSDIFPSDLNMALGSTQPLAKMSTSNIPGGKGGRCVRLTTSPPSCAECHENL